LLKEVVHVVTNWLIEELKLCAGNQNEIKWSAWWSRDWLTELTFLVWLLTGGLLTPLIRLYRPHALQR